MSIPVTLETLQSGHNSVDLLNSNFEAIEQALVGALSRTGSSPNNMASTLDMNSQRMINLPAASSNHEPATYGQVQALVADLIQEGVESVSASLVNYTHGGTGGVSRTLLQVLPRIVVVEDFGAVGDGVTDDTTAIVNAAAAASTGVLYFTYGKTYKLTTQVTCQGEWNLNGATLSFFPTGNVRCVVMASNSWIHNGSLKRTGSGTATSGEWQNFLIFGSAANTNTGVNNARATDLTFKYGTSTTSNMNSITVVNNCYNIELGNLKFEETTNEGRLILCHWGNLDLYASSVTGHPHNIWIHDIYAARMAYIGAGQSVIYLSGAHDVLVERVHSDRVATTFLYDYAGDRGKDHATAEEAKLIQKGNRFLNCNCDLVDGNSGQAINIQGLPTISTTPLYPNTIVENCKVVGGSTSLVNGIEVVYASGAIIRNCTVSNFFTGIAVGEGSKAVLIENNEVFGCGSAGISVTNNTIPPRDCEVINNYCYENGTYGIFASEQYRTLISNNELGNRSGTDSTQDYGIGIGTADRNVEIINNHFHDYTVAGILLPTSAGQYLDVMNGNTFDDLTLTTVGQDFIPYAKVPTPDGSTIIWHGVGKSTPEGTVSAPPGSTCVNTSNGKHYTKSSGTGNTGWVVTGTQT